MSTDINVNDLAVIRVTISVVDVVASEIGNVEALVSNVIFSNNRVPDFSFENIKIVMT